jgi:S1-C subfamily serine protease
VYAAGFIFTLFLIAIKYLCYRVIIRISNKREFSYVPAGISSEFSTNSPRASPSSVSNTTLHSDIAHISCGPRGAEVVGINTAIVGHANQGIGFSIPSNLAKKVYDLLRTIGIPRGWIGVDVQDLTPALADRFHLKKSQGALVARVRDHSPADQAGIAPGDVIVRWDRNQIDNSNDLRIAIAKSKPGAQATAVLYRDGRKQEVPVTVAERPNQISQ